MILKLYSKLVTDFHKFTLFSLSIIIVISFYFSKNFNLDASSDSLLLEGDKDLKYLREINNRYGSKDFLFLTYSPVTNFTDEDTIINIQLLKSKIEKLTWVDSIITIIDVPLLKSSDEPLMERLKNYKTLSYPNIDKNRGFQEILNSPIYNDYVISKDGKTSGVIIYLKKDERLNDYIKSKENIFLIARKANSLEKKYKILKEYEEYKNLYNKRNHQNISEIRGIINKYGDNAKIHLGGIPMIADDMMSYIKSDIIVFGIGVFIFIIFTLWLIFRNIKWVIMPLMGCATSVIIMKVYWFHRLESNSDFVKFYCFNVNFKYGNEYSSYSEISSAQRISKFNKKRGYRGKLKNDVPILYTVLTTIYFFLSLIFSGTKPIIDFGWMMTLGLLVSLIVTFILLPCLLHIFSENEINLKIQRNQL